MTVMYSDNAQSPTPSRPGALAVRDVPDHSRYEIDEDGHRVGLLAYWLADGELSLVHAEVDPAAQGRGIASRLTRFALDDARARGLRVRPICPFVVDYVARHPGEFDDVLA